MASLWLFRLESGIQLPLEGGISQEAICTKRGTSPRLWKNRSIRSRNGYHLSTEVAGEHLEVGQAFQSTRR